MKRALTVRQFNEYIKTSLKHDPIFQNLCIKGEVANLRLSHNHIYFSLKEDVEIIDCVIYYYEDKDFNTKFSIGDEIEIYGNLLFNNYSSRLIISVRKIEEFGISESYKEYIKLKKYFEDKGYFLRERKKEINPYPKKVGLITSKDGAAIYDFVNIINQKPNDINIFFYPAKVQGENSASDIVLGLQELEKLGLDCILITRGGGSKEDLSVFNDKLIIEEIFKINTPIISAIGHKIDSSLTDLVSDLSLQTPTEAGSYLVRNYINLYGEIKKIYGDISKTIIDRINTEDFKLSYIKKELDKFNPNRIIDLKLNDLNLLYNKFEEIITNSLYNHENKLSILKVKLDSYKRIIDINKNKISIFSLDGNSIYSKYSIKDKDILKIKFSDGEILVEVKDEQDI